MGVGTRFSINQEGATFVCTNQVGMSTIPCGMVRVKGKTHVAKQVKKETHLFMEQVKEKIKS